MVEFTFHPGDPRTVLNRRWRYVVHPRGVYLIFTQVENKSQANSFCPGLKPKVRVGQRVKVNPKDGLAAFQSNLWVRV